MRSLLAGALLVAVALVVGFQLGAGTAATVDPTTPPPTAMPRPTPTATPFDPAVVATAVVIPARSADLALATAGRVEAVLVEPEMSVIAEDVLLRLDSSSQEAALNVAIADERRAEAAVERAVIQLDLISENGTPAQLESARAELRLAEAELELTRSTLAEAEVALAETELTAPFAGTVVAVDVTIGEQVVAGQAVIVLADMSGWFLETTDLGELDVVRISVGDRATVGFDALPDLQLSGTVARIQVRGTTDQGLVRFGVLIRPDRHVAELRWNMSATVRILPGS